MARERGILVALVGTVGGRSSEYALEMIKESSWESLNLWGVELN